LTSVSSRGVSSATSGDPSPLRVGRYWLRPVLQVRQDELRRVLPNEPGIYVCNAPEEDWYARFGLERRHNPGTQKKERMFRQMAPGSQWVSMTTDRNVQGSTSRWTSPKGVVHLGSGALRGRLAQLRMAAALAGWLVRRRHSFAYAYVYNFDEPQFLSVRGVTWLLGKGLIVDYEDDYTRCRRSRWKNALERAMRRTVDGAVCVHEGMLPYFERVPTAVWNTFADLSYLQPALVGLRPGMSLLYSGRFDEIRGIDLLPALVTALRDRIGTFQIRVTGSGPLEPWVRALESPEVVYRGFLSDAELAREVAAADACLILQKPDHPFSQGSFPSKIEAYAAARKPIWRLELAEA
jgi:glycosyltransferase involved in cell wall biosynthesis